VLPFSGNDSDERTRGAGSGLLQEGFDGVGHQDEVLQLAGRVAGGAVGGDHRIVVGHGLALGPEGATDAPDRTHPAETGPPRPQRLAVTG